MTYKIIAIKLATKLPLVTMEPKDNGMKWEETISFKFYTQLNI